MNNYYNYVWDIWRRWKYKNYKKDILLMSNSLIHRGPDDKGFYSTENVILNRNRLSIIDLTKKDHNQCNLLMGDL